MRFEYDPNKSESNKEKHGIDFQESQVLWNDPGRITIQSIKEIDEPRHLIIGIIDGNHWAAITTIRNDRTRIISVRRARKREVKLYEEKNIS